MDLKKKLLENTEALIAKVDQVSDSQFNTKPGGAEDSWSVADVVEHLYRSEFGIPKLFTGKTEAVVDRAPDAYLEVMRKRFLESDKKMKASDITLPTKGKKPKEALISKFRKNRRKIAELTGELTPEALCLLFEHPIYGYLTRLEWVHFNIIHAQRHMRQIERIKSQIN
ncbi:MAG: DinB family protein [Gracilimonas sp.]|uniref:DinB family protein n=1 Tax=Gracilimonas sp. TaxID=1974203 RepID=UPI0019C4B796|nr:DinB family protein [Gracilimonas sp.]MBD3614972.1 DinB family protein [Gracilimonas sp.]